jgi:NADH:quinone reductase (non-electrogenic)
MNDNIQVVVIGGGYAGVLAANRLRQRTDIDVTLVNRRSAFVERIRLHQLVAGTNDAVEDYATLLADGVRLMVDSAERIDAAAHRVRLASGDTLGYDYLIYAVGSTGSVPAGVPGADQFAYPLSELEPARRLADRLADVGESAPMVIVGGGLTGIEAAAEFAETGRPVSLATDVLGPSLGAGGRRSVAKRLAKLGVTVIEGAVVARVAADHVTLVDGRELPSAVTVWTAGFAVPKLAAASGLTTDPLGRLLTDETLTSLDTPSIVAAGDAACPSGLPLRMSCQAALPMGAQAANTILARVADRQPAALNQAFTGQCISLGRHAATVQLAHLDDAPLPLHIGGRFAASIKEAVCKGTVSFLTREARKPGSYFWLKGGKRARRVTESLTEPVTESVPESVPESLT